MCTEARADDECVAAGQCEVGLSHFTHELVEAYARGPAKALPRLRGIAKQRFNFSRPVVARVNCDDTLSRLCQRIGCNASDYPVLLRPFAPPFDAHAQLVRGAVHEVPDRMLYPSRDNVVLWS